MIPEGGSVSACASCALLGAAFRQGHERRKIPAHIGLLLRPRPPLDPPLRGNGVCDPFVVFGKDKLHRPSFESVPVSDQAPRMFAPSLLHRASGDSGVIAAGRPPEDIDRPAD